MDTLTIRYDFMFEDGKCEAFGVHLNAETLLPAGDPPEDLPEWTRLAFEQCPNCPLAAQMRPRCPSAVQLVELVSRFGDIVSFETVKIQVVTRERTVTQKTTAQKAISSLMGLIMATSGCPRTAYFRPMARFHLPLASEDETLYRAASMYLLAQYFRRQAGGEADLELKGLTDIYESLETLNAAMARRLLAAIQQDATVNAVVILDFLAKNWFFSIEDRLEDMRHLFAAYLE